MNRLPKVLVWIKWQGETFEMICDGDIEGENAPWITLYTFHFPQKMPRDSETVDEINFHHLSPDDFKKAGPNTEYQFLFARIIDLDQRGSNGLGSSRLPPVP